MHKIMVTGATGHLGKAALLELLKTVDPANLFALVRNPAKAEDLAAKGVTLVTGDYDNYDSLVKAFEGVDKLYFVSSSDVMNRLPQQENVVKAATAAGVKHIIYTSFQRKTDDGSTPIAFVAAAHIKTEQLILASGLTYTILKHSLYADVMPMFMGDKVLETGIWLPAGEGKVSFATRNDMAAAGAAVLTGEGHENKTYEIAGSVAYNMSDIAGMLSELSGKTVAYISPDPAVFTQQLQQAGVPEEGIQGTLAFCLAIAQGEFNFPDATMERLLGRAPKSLKDYLKQAYQL